MGEQERQELEQLYSNLLSSVVRLARTLGKPCPVVTRAERRETRAPDTTQHKLSTTETIAHG